MSATRSSSPIAPLYRFGPYELDTGRAELRKFGLRLRLERKPLQLLLTLVDRAGEVVTRRDLQRLLWTKGVFVDFDKGLTVAVTKLRAALNDSSDNPRYIRTVAGEGYQFLAAVEKLTFPSAAQNSPESGARSFHDVEQPIAGAGHARVRWLQHRWPGVSGAFLAFAITAAVALLAVRHFSSQTKPALNFQARDWVLISNLENRTGEPVFDGTLEYALERELSNSQFVNVVPRERINDALRLMRRPLDSKIDQALGREICLRDGGIRIMLTGRIEKLGTTFLLTVGLVDTARGTTVVSISEEDPADSRMATGVRRLSDRVRETLGEERSLIQQSDQRLEKVTTPSLHALQLYTQADDAIRLHSFDVAAEMLERALQEDPNFASAQLLLGFAYADVGSKLKSAPYFERAFELADTVTDRERFFILGSYYEAVGHNPQKVVDAYETLLQLYPDHFWGTHNLSGWYESMGRTEDASRLLVRQAELAPNDLRSNVEAVWAKAILDQDWKGAQRYRDRANALLAQQGHTADAFMAFMPIWIKLLPVYESWLQGNLQRSHAQLEQLEASGNLEGVEAGYAHLAFGELRRAEECFRVDSDRDWFAGAEGVLLFIRGDWSALKKFLPNERRIAYPGSTASVFMARARMWSDVERAVREAGQEWGPPYRSEITEGELALARGDSKDGISLLEQGLIARRWWPDASFFLGSNSLAGAYEKQGRLDEALRVLQRASREKGHTVPDPSKGPGDFASVWMTSDLELADLYRKMGRVSDAEKVEGELRNMLVYADPDHPVLLALRGRPQAAGVLASR